MMPVPATAVEVCLYHLSTPFALEVGFLQVRQQKDSDRMNANFPR